MSFSLVQKARALIGEVMELLGETRLQQAVDEPIDQALEHFLASVPEDIARGEIHTLIGGAISDIRQNALRPPSKPTFSQAIAEGLNLLAFSSPDGIEGCLVDASDPDIGIDGVISRLGAAMKAQRRQQIRLEVYWRCIESIDWPLRCQVARQLLDLRQTALPSRMRTLDPAEVCHALREMFDLELAVRGGLETLRGRPGPGSAIPSAGPLRSDSSPLRCG